MAEHGPFSESTALSLLVLALGAFAIPLLCRPLRLPAAVGEILFGILVGPFVLGWVEVSDFIRLLAQLGFFLLMFIGGLELDFTQIEKGGLKALGRALFCTALILAGSFLTATVLGYHWFVGMVLGAISIGIPLVLLHETGLGRQPFGQFLLLVGSVGEFAVILVATTISAYGASGGVNWELALELLKLSAVFVLAYVLLVVFRSLVWWKSESFARIVTYHDPSEIGVRAGLALMFVFVAVASILHIDPILGAFIAGALFSFVFRAKGPLEIKFMSIGNGFLVPFFFISVGLEFDLGAAREGDIGMLLQLLICLFLIRLTAFWISRPREQGFRKVLAASLLYSAPLTLLVVIANLGLHLQLVDATFHSTVILLAVMSSTLYPFLFKAVLKKIPSSDP
jgi:Kef-type K+ transport system membrane component KefB